MIKELAEIFGFLIVLVGTLWAGLKFNRVLARQTVIENKQRALDDLNEKVEAHHLRTDMHIVPGREDRILDMIKESFREGFQNIVDRLDKIDARCEKRGEACSEHFSRLEKKVAIKTGNANGD